jgi:hypothetical protein
VRPAPGGCCAAAGRVRPEAARQPSSGKIIRLESNLVVGLCGTLGDADPPPDQEGSNSNQHNPNGRPEPEEGNRKLPRLAEHPRKPDRGEHDLERQEDEAVATSGTLIATGKPGGNGGLVRIGDALAPSDGMADTSSGVGAKVMLEGESPFGVAALLNPAVHGRCCTPGWACRPRTAAAGGRPQGRP